MINRFINTNNNKRYYTLDYYNKKRFNNKVFKISLNGGFTCPNKDGTKGYGGCIYCSKLGSGDFAGNVEKSLIEQFNDGKKLMEDKWSKGFYIGFFQANTNTYAKIDVLKQKYEPILELDNVVGLAIATRPDAIDNDCLDYLEDLNKRTYLTVELGLQTIHPTTTKLINRGHDLKTFTDMVHELRKRNIDVIVHIINGLPYETKEMMMETAKFLNTCDIQGVKIHMLHVIKDTALEELYKKENFHILSKQEYVEIVCDQLEYLNKDIVIHRITGDAKKEDLIVPLWTLKKFSIMDDIDVELDNRGTYQGFNNSIFNRLQERIDRYVKYSDLVIDATGFDSFFLAAKVKDGYLYGFNPDTSIIDKTNVLLSSHSIDNYRLFDKDFSCIRKVLNEYDKKISFILFNLKIMDEYNISETISDALNLLNNKGVIILVIYPKYDSKLIELKKFLKNKNVKYFFTDNKKTDPYIIEIKK